ncbi:hypothetical protein S245_020798 [Arachis hypogaea]
MLSIASLNPSTPFNHFPDYAVHYIFNHHSLLPSTFSLPSIRIPVALPPPTDHSTCAPLMPFNSSTMNQSTPRSSLSPNALISELSTSQL